MVNDMTGSEGRLCNHIIRALGASFIAKSQNLKFNYGEYYSQMKQLGIDLYNGTMTYNSEVVIPNNIMPYISVPLFKNINVSSSYFQTKEFSNYLYSYYQIPCNQESVIKANIFSNRYKNNEDVFIHVRLGDVSDKNPGFSYYDKVLSQLTFDKGYIASDQLDHDICKRLIKKYNLIEIKYNEVETIMFGSSCKYIVLTGGSFSYIIGLLGFFSKIYYIKGDNSWYPAELFYIDDWTKINNLNNYSI